MPQCLSQGQRRVAAVQRLVWIAQQPQRKGGMAETHHPEVYSMHHRIGLVSLWFIERHPLLQIGPGRGQLAQKQADAAHHVGRWAEERGVVEALGQLEELLREGTCRL
jgi:hypothetical protein